MRARRPIGFSCRFFFKKKLYILLSMLLHLSHFFSSFYSPPPCTYPPTSISPALVHVHGSYIQVLWLLHFPYYSVTHNVSYFVALGIHIMACKCKTYEQSQGGLHPGSTREHSQCPGRLGTTALFCNFQPLGSERNSISSRHYTFIANNRNHLELA